MKLVTHLLKVGTLISTLAFILSVLFQIYARFFLESAPPWTEEASRFFFLYAVGFSAALAAKDNEYVYIDTIYNYMGPAVKKILDIFISFIVTVLFLIMSIYAVDYIFLGVTEKSPSMGISMAWSFGSILIMAVSMVIYYAKETYDIIQNR